MPGNLFPNTITIQTKTTTNVQGGQVATYASSYSNVAALVAPASAGWREFYNRRNITITHSIYTARQISVRTGDIVVFGTRRFVIQGLLNQLEARRLYQIDCLEVQTTGELLEGQ